MRGATRVSYCSRCGELLQHGQALTACGAAHEECPRWSMETQGEPVTACACEGCEGARTA